MFSHSRMRLQPVGKLPTKVNPDFTNSTYTSGKFKISGTKTNMIPSSTNQTDLKQKDQHWPSLWQWTWCNLCLSHLPRQRLDSGRLSLLQLCQLLLQQVSFLPQAGRVLHLSVQQAAKRPVQKSATVSETLFKEAHGLSVYAVSINVLFGSFWCCWHLWFFTEWVQDE